LNSKKKEGGIFMSSTDKQKIVEIMKKACLHTYLATADGDQPRVRPVSPIVEEDMSIWVTTFGNSRKVKQIKQNPKICLAFVEQPNGDRAAIVVGEAEIIPDMEQKKRVWKLATFDLSQYFTKGPESEEFCLLKIIPQKIEWRDNWAENKVYKPEGE
jgi:general stress protein 26